MKRNVFIMLIGMIFVALLIGCGSTSDDAEQTTGNNNDNDDAVNEKEEPATNEEVDEPSNVALPDGFPADFPFPDNISITDVRDKSEGDQKDFTIQFTFDPDLDLEAVFNMYDEYAHNIGYESIVEGEEYFADDIFQYAAMLSSSTSNMLVVTMKPTDDTYGSIDFKFEE